MIAYRSNRVAGVALFIALIQSVSAAERGRLAWHTDVNEAWEITQREGRPLLVFVDHDHCAYCVKMKNGTFAESRVAAAIMASYVPLALDGAAPLQLVKDLAITAYPTTFVISPQAVIIDRIEGYVPAEELMARLTATKKDGRVAKLVQAQ